MQKWEYLHLNADVQDNGVVVRDITNKIILPYAHRKPLEYQDFLNKLGNEGWELVACLVGSFHYSQKIYFKRPIE